MTRDPKRWLDDEDGAPEGARELLAQARRTPPVDKRALAVSAAALVKLGTQPASAAAAVLAKLSAAPAAIAGLPLVAKVAVISATVAVVAVAGVQVVPRLRDARSHAPHQTASVAHARPSQHAQVPQADVRPLSAPVAPLAVIAQAATTASPRSSVAATPSTPAHAQRRAPRVAAAKLHAPSPSAPPATASEPPDALALEVQWLDDARRLLPSSPSAALARADAHAQRFTAPALGAERELIAIDALQRLSRTQEARARADAFRARYPGSLYRDRLVRLLRGRQ